MTPFEQAARWHLEQCADYSFADVVEAHFQKGIVISDGCRFVMARPVRSDWPEHLIRDPWSVAAVPDCWHCWLWAGDLRGWWMLAPYHLEFLSFHRGERLALKRFPTRK